jgi:hypothetical protein
LCIASDITLIGNSTDVWIFQVAETFNMSSVARINLAGGAKAENILVEVQKWSMLQRHLEGTHWVSIAVQTGATPHIEITPKQRVTLQKNTKPVPQTEANILLFHLIKSRYQYLLVPDFIGYSSIF